MGQHLPRLRAVAVTVAALGVVSVIGQGHARAQAAATVAPSSPVPASAPAETLEAALARMTNSRSVVVRLPLSDLGITRPILLSGIDARRDLFLPVPKGVPIRDASVALEGRYLRGDGGRTTYVAQVDGTPLVARSVTEDQGVIADTLKVPGTGRRTGFVNLSVAWSSSIAQHLCGDERSIGNIFEISPATQFTYRYDRDGVRDIATAWSALPPHPVLMVPAGPMTAETYDTAWRLAAVLAQAGKTARIVAVPRLGDEVDTTGLDIPAALSAVPAFRDLAKGGRQRISRPAEIGALLLASGGLAPDVAVDADVLRNQLNEGLQGLEAEVGATSREAAAALAQWRAQGAAVSTANANVRLVTLAGRPVIAVTPGAGAAVAGLFSDLWRATAIVPMLKVAKARNPDVPAGASVQLAQLGNAASSLDVLARGDWSATFDLAGIATGGQVPSEFLLDVSAAPGAGTSSPVASVFLNDYLLGAKSLTANGKPERISVKVPRYALAARNVLRVSFQRQPLDDRCREVPQAFPVAVLPSSRVVLSEPERSVDFLGVVPRLAGKATLVVPQQYLANASSLPLVVSMVEASGLSPERATLMVSADDAEARPESAFLSVGARVAGVGGKVRVEQGRLVLTGANDQALLDVSGLDQLGVAEAVDANGQLGIVYRTIGDDAPRLTTGFLLGRGDVSVLAAEGPISVLDTRQPGAETQPNTDPFSAFLNRGPSWGPIALGAGIVLFLVFLILAQRARRRAAKGH